MDKEIFNRAADRIERTGWFGGPTGTLDGPYTAESPSCAALAIKDEGGFFEEIYAFADFLGADTSRGAYLAIYRWNDEQESPEEVVAKLREFAQS